MAEVITSPIANSINAIRRRFSASTFAPAMNAIRGDKNSPVDPELTRIIIRNTNAVNTVTTQLSSVASQVNVLTNALTAISQSLALSSQLEDQRMNAEANRQRQLATLGLREGKEGAIEKKIANAALAPVEYLAKKATNILSALGQYFGTILFGWLGTQTLDYLAALASGNEEKIAEIRNKLLTGLALGASAFIAVNVAITALARMLSGLAKKAIEITFKNLIKKPFISLINLFRKGAGASLMQGGMRNLPPPPLGQAKNLLPGNKLSPLARVGNFFKSSLPFGLFDAGIDVMGGKNPVGAAIDTSGGLLGGKLVSKLPMLRGKGGIVKWLASTLGFFGTKSIVQNQRVNLIGGNNQQQVQPQGGDGTVPSNQLLKQQLLSGEVSVDQAMEGLTPQAAEGGEKKEGNRGLLGWRSSLDWMTGGLTDFDKKGNDFNLFNGKSDKKEQLKQQDLTLQEPAPEVINLAAGGDQQTQNGSSGTGGLGGNVPKIPANNNDNTYVYSGFREYQIAPV